MKIAEKEYENLKLNQKIRIDNQTIGYVSDVVNNKATGEQAYIITDGNPKTQKIKDIKNVTVLYRGSSATIKEPMDSLTDWLDNNLDIDNQLSSVNPLPKTPTIQMISSAKTLNKYMDKYSNAKFEVYGHSQGSTNGQYALSALDSEDKISRIKGAFLYEGPNAYLMLNDRQRKTAKKLKDKIFNFVDDKDFVTIGYGNTEQLWKKVTYMPNPKHIGTLINVASKKAKDLVAQHMWGGYVLKKGVLQVRPETLAAFEKAKNKLMLANMLEELDSISVNLKRSGGGLSTNEKIYLDSEAARIVVQKISSDYKIATDKLISIYQKAIIEAQELWQNTLYESRSMGPLLTEWEVRDTLQMTGFTEQTIITNPCDTYQDKLNKIMTVASDFDRLTNEITAKISEIVQRDRDLAHQLKGI
ncbi:hypothetical protein [Pseudolactococcus piscium]|nr:hypothetical protein [Lactococcus piscium]